MAKKIEFLPEQKKAINLRNRNILVSASAGTGKTAVLTERIISILLDEEKPVDIDRLVVVTFTRAAASEMRTRIGNKLNDRLKEGGHNVAHIRKQIALLPHAQITTIDSFCLSILRNYFYKISLDPAFAVVDENDNSLMMAEVCNEILEERYSEASDAFLDMVEHLVTGKDDSVLNDIILRLYKVASSHPWPYEWLDSCKKIYSRCTKEEFDSLEWVKDTGLMEQVKYVCEEEKERCIKACEMCSPENVQKFCTENSNTAEDDKLAEVHTFMKEELEMIERIRPDLPYSECKAVLDNIEFRTFPGKRVTGQYKELKEMVKAQRDKMKKNMTALISDYFSKPVEVIINELAEYENTINELVDITKEFIKRFALAKREENVIDFNDVEHMVLDILYERDEEGNLVKSQAAKELMEQYAYIMIDEYQDSNEVQETILTAFSRESIGDNNLFMVGDIKQSIYSFRLAKPDIFENKRRTYTDSDSDCQRIYLSKNFRSNGKILSAVNFIFGNMMDESVGGVTYDENHYFAVDDESNNDSEPVEIIYVADGKADGKTNSETDYAEGNYTETDEGYDGIALGEPGKRELEATVIASRIRKLVEEGKYSYGDIVILLRSMSGWAEEFVETLTMNGVPVIAEEKSGYFSAYEIQIVLSMPKIIDNPNQDIPLVAVLKSVFGNMDETDLAAIRVCSEGNMYDALVNAAWISVDDERQDVTEDKVKKCALAKKCTTFLEMLENFRKKAPYMKVYELIEDILATNDFAMHMRVMPAGDRRYGNLRMLVDKAIAYDTQGKTGIFGFLLSIDKLKKASIDFGEADRENDGADAVRIMSIHKSKGLEFPVVFVAGMGKRFNLKDINDRFPVHADIGPVPDIYDYNRRTRRKTLLKKAVGRKMLRDTLGEEMRVLYVALTRAKYKLILTGHVGDTDKFFEKCEKSGEEYSFRTSYTSTSYSFITPALMKHEDWQRLDDVSERVGEESSSSNNLFDIKVVTLKDVILDEGMRAGGILERREKLEKLAAGSEADSENGSEICSEICSEIGSILKKQQEYRYPYEEEVSYAMKVSVSDIKHSKAMEEDAEAVRASWVATEEPEYIPLFIRGKEEKKMNGADRGTMYHSLMQYLDLNIVSGADAAGDVGAVGATGDVETSEGIDAAGATSAEEAITQQINGLIEKGVLSEFASGKDGINVSKIKKFVCSDIAIRMKRAESLGKLYREQPFVMGVPADMVYPESKGDETIIVQGIIDAFFEEDDGIVLLDYKTDSIRFGEEEKLIKRYKAQMECYAMAIEKAMGKKVKEVILYSFALGKEIR